MLSDSWSFFKIKEKKKKIKEKKKKETPRIA